MTTPHPDAAAHGDGTGATCLAVVYCAGPGCRSTDIAPGHRGTGAAALRAAVRERRQAVLVAAVCLRRCQPGGTAAVGWAAVGDGRIRWTTPPVVVDGLDSADAGGGRVRAAVLADWIRSGAPDPGALCGLIPQTGPPACADQPVDADQSGPG